MSGNLFIFDLDGTLLDTRADLAAACNHALEMCGCPARRLEEYNMLIGRGIDNLFRGALPPEMRTEDMIKKMRSYFLPYYKEHKCDMTRPYEGIIPLLEHLTSSGASLAVASNKYQEGTEELVRKFFGEFEFVSILGQREGHPIKPDPDIIYEAMHGIDADNVYYCGDSDVDMQTGIAAGVRTIGVTWGLRSREELEAYEPWLIVDSPEEISRNLK